MNVGHASQPVIYFVSMGLLEWKLDVDLEIYGQMIIFN